MQPTWRSTALFHVKANALRLRRVFVDGVRGGRSRGRRSDELTTVAVSGASVTPLWTQASNAEFRLVAGKIENLRIAVRALHGREFGAGEVFSFWKALGLPTRLKGYREGREIREGCVIPSIAGGLCQLSNGLYDAALKAGMEIRERHAHTRVVAGSLAEAGRDATVFWNYVDLRFTARTPFRIEAALGADSLTVALRVAPQAQAKVGQETESRYGTTFAAASCETCGVHACFRHQALTAKGESLGGRAAVLVDAFWPEHDAWIQQQLAASTNAAKPWLFAPLLHQKLPQYGWTTAAFERARQAPLVTLHRAATMRRLAAQGPARRRAALAFDDRLAAAYARSLPIDATHLIVSHDLLLPLWRAGVLGGRTYDVLLQRPPLALLQRELDRAAALHSESLTLADFRVPSSVVREEELALAGATRLVTPSLFLARHLGPRAVKLPWHKPAQSPLAPLAPHPGRPRVLLAGPTAGRRGAYELRAAARTLGLEVLLRGPALEGANFWSDVATRRLAPGTPDVEAIAQADVIYAGAFVDAAPRLALRALSLGRPVAASYATGLSHADAPAPRLSLFEAGDAAAVAAALEACYLGRDRADGHPTPSRRTQ